MKTIFTEDELKDFIKKKCAEIEGASILLMAQKSEGDEITFTNVGDKFFQLGQSAGEIEGQLKFLKDFHKFIGL